MGIQVYACRNINTKERLMSSSGGIFACLASYILECSGVVYGVTMSDDCYSAEFISITNYEDIVKLMGSKYLQANIGDTYTKVAHDIKSGRKVLFTGTGCQVNGLLNYLKMTNIPCDNLLTVDVICHGVSSPALWRKYVQYQEEKNGGKLVFANFRCKDDSWEKFGIKEHFSNDDKANIKKLYISKNEDAYMQMFLNDYSLRPSCYSCKAKKCKLSDITIGDFWGINNIAPNMNDGTGVSIALVRSQKGTSIFKELSDKLEMLEVEYELGVKNNPVEYRSAFKPKKREEFFQDMINLDFDKLSHKYVNSKLLVIAKKIKAVPKHCAIKLKKFVCGGGYNLD